MAVGLGRQAAGLDHAVEAHDEGLAFDLELRLVEIVDDVLHRKAERIFREDVENRLGRILRCKQGAPRDCLEVGQSGLARGRDGRQRWVAIGCGNREDFDRTPLGRY